MKWFITKDHVKDPTDPEDPDMSGCGFAYTGNGSSLPYRFRLRDDDGVVYYEGRAEGTGFEPLHWARDYAGCTEIQFLEEGVWNTL